MVGPARVGGIMASSSRPRRSQRRLKKAPPKKRRAGVAAGKPRKAGTNKAGTNKAARTAGKTAAPGIVETALATFAHEVRTPLTGILAISDLLATSDLDERERRWVDTIKAGAEHLASLATLFVDAARSGRSGFGVRHDFFDLRTLAHSVGELCLPAGRPPRACSRGSRFRRNCPPSSSATPFACGRRWKT